MRSLFRKTSASTAVEAPRLLSGDDVPEYLRGVEIASAGMEWPASTGTVTVTMDHLRDAATAASDDPHVQAPRLRLGHTSALNGDQPRFDPFAALGDAEPSFGRWTNLRLENDGAVLVGDITDVPEWLAMSAPSAYPSRSMECVWDVETNGGKQYSMVVTAVSFLGAELPAISDLEDLSTFVAQGPTALPVPDASEFSVSADHVRRSFNFDWATGENDFDGDTYWWWARDVRLAPDGGEVIADDDAGALYSVPFSITTDDEVSFGDPVPVRETFIPIPTPTAAAYARPDKEAAMSRKNTRPEGGAALSAEARSLLEHQGINPDEATEEQTSAAEQAAAVLNGTSGEPEENAGSEGEAEPAPSTDSGADETAASRGVTIDRDAFAQLRADAAAGREARDSQVGEERAAFLADRLNRGKFPPSALSAYETQLAQGGEIEAATREFIDGLPDGTVPVGRTSFGAAAGDGEPSVVPEDLSLLTPIERAARA